MYWNRKWHVYYVVSKRLFFTIFFFFSCSQAFLTCVANLQTCCHTRMLWVVKATVNAVIINGKSVSIMQNKQDYHPMNMFQHARSFMITFEWYTCWDVHLSRQKTQTLFMFLLLLPDKKTTAENERGLLYVSSYCAIGSKKYSPIIHVEWLTRLLEQVNYVIVGGGCKNIKIYRVVILILL